MSLTQPQKISAWLLVLYWPGLFILAHVPIPKIVQKVNISDKSLHFCAYLVLTFLVWSAVGGGQKVKWRRLRPWLILSMIMIYAILDEWLQSYVSGRVCDVWDFFTDMAGALSSMILASFLSFWSAGLLIVSTFIFGINILMRANLADLMPVTNIIFHFLAYALLTVLWIKSTHLFPAMKVTKPNWLFLALAGPIGFLITVKLFSVIIGKDFIFAEVIISSGAIVTVVTDFYLRALFKKTKKSQKEKTKVL